MTVEKPKPTQLLQPITTGAESAMDQSQLLKAQERSRGHGAIGFGFGFGFASHWLKNWRESFKPITNHLKTALAVLIR